MAENYTAAVVTVSDRSFRGERPDGSGPVVKDLLEQAGYQVAVSYTHLDVYKRQTSACQ